MAQLSILDLMEQKTSLKLNIDEDIVAKVIRHKWKSMHEASNLFTSLEDSGLCKFSIRPKKVTLRLVKIEEILAALDLKLKREDLKESTRGYSLTIRDRLLEEKAYLETKI